MKDTPSHRQPQLPDRKAWLFFLEPAFASGPEAADSAARMLRYLLRELGNGSDGVGRVRRALNDGLRLTYVHTTEFEKAFEHYLLFLDGELAPADEPVPLLSQAIQRTKARRANRKQRGRKQS